MSLLPALFIRGERMRPLGPALRPTIEPKKIEPKHDWSFAQKSDHAPEKVRLHLTEEAQAEADDFDITTSDRGCSCCISPPCCWCTHPGNPHNLVEDDDAWVMGYETATPGGA